MIYLDHASATPVMEPALEAMMHAARESWGNPASVHGAGRRARAALDQARIAVADYLGCSHAELRWEPSGTAALGHALRFALLHTRGPIVSSHLEHPAVRGPLEEVAKQGREVRWLPLPAGEWEEAQATKYLEGAEVVALSAMNHELGTAPDLAPLLALAPRAWWVVDAVQAAAWRDVRPLLEPRVFLACASQKLGGPPGAAVVRVPPELAFSPAAGVAAAFEPTPGSPPWLAAIGMGAACRERKALLPEGLPQVRARALRLLEVMGRACPELVHNGGKSWLGPILDVSIPDIDARTMESALDLRGICIARTSACLQARVVASPVVAEAFPEEPWRADTALRWSLGLTTTDEDILQAVEAWRSALGELRP
ncbi:hypothetical protein CYFUS_008079 [Cystobacter fuscus]|uniref:Aminotransferase class V domain-containing protein n=1 Tax=Cystobacter fuscus TaxID=43 RepID=A0A250JG64_9BACT|nr:aminotransferase class V-fold PLP-dependent enzyme [Cystobacter fuscus]ATB42600.1 hypothetical protein CYFUS_008079 [Cystobacter fuscus]